MQITVAQLIAELGHYGADEPVTIVVGERPWGAFPPAITADLDGVALRPLGHHTSSDPHICDDCPYYDDDVDLEANPAAVDTKAL